MPLPWQVPDFCQLPYITFSYFKYLPKLANTQKNTLLAITFRNPSMYTANLRER